MTIKEMYENNRKMEELKEVINNHNAIIASGRNVDEKYFEQLKNSKYELAGMKEITEEQIDEKVAEYEEIINKYEQNNKRMKELKELIESHNAIIASGRNVPEEFFNQLKGFKEELATMKEVPKKEIIPYKRQLAIAYKDKLNKAPEKNKEYDDLKELADTHKSIISSGINVGEKYGDQYTNMEKRLSSMSRVSEEDINKWKKTLEEVAEDDKEIDQLKELIETHESMIKSGMKVGEKFGEQLENLKKQLAERTADIVKEKEEKAKSEADKKLEELKKELEEKTSEIANRKQKETEKDNDNKEETALTVVEKQNIFSRIGKSLKNFGSKIAGLFKKKEENKEPENREVGDTAKEWRQNFKEEYLKNLEENAQEVRKELQLQAGLYKKGKEGTTPEVEAARKEAGIDFDKDIIEKYYNESEKEAYYAGKDQNGKDNDFSIEIKEDNNQPEIDNQSEKDDEGR